MKTLYVTDLDGTLLRTDDTVSPFTINTVNGLVDKGMLFTYATARSLVSASVVTKGLSARIPVIAYNGAFIYNAETGIPLYSLFFTPEDLYRGHIPVRCLLIRQIHGLLYISYKPVPSWSDRMISVLL